MCLVNPSGYTLPARSQNCRPGGNAAHGFHSLDPCIPLPACQLYVDGSPNHLLAYGLSPCAMLPSLRCSKSMERVPSSRPRHDCGRAVRPVLGFTATSLSSLRPASTAGTLVALMYGHPLLVLRPCINAPALPPLQLPCSSLAVPFHAASMQCAYRQDAHSSQLPQLTGPSLQLRTESLK